MLETISDYVVIRFNKSTRLVPFRVRMFHSICITLFYYMLSHVPLYGETDGVDLRGSFQRPSTWMSLGMSPYALPTILFPSMEPHNQRVLAFMFSVVQIVLKYALSWPTLQLILVSWCIMETLLWMESRSGVQLASSLIFLGASTESISQGFELGAVWTLVYLSVLCMCMNITVPVPVSHNKTKHRPIGANIPMMYNGTVAITSYFALSDVLLWFGVTWPTWIDCIAQCAFMITMNKVWHRITKRGGRSLISKWKKQGYSLKGWRSEEKQSKYVDRVIGQCVHASSIVFAWLTCVSWFAVPSVPLPFMCVMLKLLKDLRSQAL